MIPKVTIIMPVYNGEKYLREAINSILNQTFTDFEFVIIDDGSSDSSVDIIQSYHDSRIILLKNLKNHGIFYSLNLGLSLAKGEYIARMDCDDISKTERLEKQVTFLDNNLKIGIVGAWVDIINNSSQIIETWTYPSESYLIKWEMFFSCPFAHPTVVFRKSIIALLNGYSTEDIHTEDYELWWRFSKITEFANIPESLLYYRIHENNITKTQKDNRVKNATELNHFYIEEFLDKKVNYEVTYNIYTQNINDCSKVNDIIHTILDIFVNFRKQYDNNMDKLKNLKIDVANKIYLFSRPHLKNNKTWIFLLMSFYFSPQLIVVFTRSIVFNLTHKLTRKLQVEE